MRFGLSLVPARRILFWGLVLNAIWEFAQCGVFYDMWNWGLLSGIVWMCGAIAGDVLIVFAVVCFSFLITGAAPPAPLRPAVWIVLLGVGLVAGVFFEWVAQILHLWGYSEWMPVLSAGGYEVGLLPIVQIAVLPALAVYLARPRTA